VKYVFIIYLFGVTNISILHYKIGQTHESLTWVIILEAGLVWKEGNTMEWIITTQC